MKNKMIIVFLTIVLILGACTLPTTSGVDLNTAEATAVALTVQASFGNSSSPLVPVTLQAITPSGSGSKPALPTLQPPTAQPTKASAVSDNTAPIINNVTTSDTRAYYLGNTCGSTSVTFSAKVSDNSGSITQVWVDYQIVAPAAGVGGNQWYQVNLFSSGGGVYQATVDIDLSADNELQGNDGTLQFQVFAMDASGNIQTEPNGFVYGVEILVCGQVGIPPGGAGAPVTISNIVLNPQNAVFYGPCNTEPTMLNVQAAIDPLDQITSATIYYAYSSSAGSFGNYSTLMYQLGIGDYAGDIDAGAEAGHVLGSAEGAIDFYIQVMDKSGNTIDSPFMSIFLDYCTGAGGNQGGNGTVRFHNNSSHSIVELVIDGTDVILSEAQTILEGGFLDVTISEGSHNFQAGAGFWSGGSKASIYPLPGGSFTNQSGSMTINDPSIEQIMTNYGNNTYYAGQYWDDTTPYCAAFNFYVDGSFDFYIDGNWNDSGTYSLVSRQAGSYSVVFNVVNSTGAEQYNGTYYYSGAPAGEMYMNNGPPGWEQITYVLNGGCP